MCALPPGEHPDTSTWGPMSKGGSPARQPCPAASPVRPQSLPRGGCCPGASRAPARSLPLGVVFFHVPSPWLCRITNNNIGDDRS